MKRLVLTLSLTALLLAAALPNRAAERPSPAPYGQWKNGPSADPGYFPIAVWLQSPSNAARYRDAGINLYVGLYRGPNAEQLAELKAANMRVVCSQNAFALQHLDDPTFAGWMHGDEPDNAQALPGGKGYGGPVPAEKIVADYKHIREQDPSRPVLLNLGQGVANDEWIGRAAKVEDYPRYCEGSDIVSFDVYPVAELNKPQSENYLWYVPRGVDRLRQWTADKKLAWNCIECTQIGREGHKATPAQVRSEVWMSLIHGSRGLIYFVHQFKPRFNEHALLDDPEMLAAVTALNKQIKELAPVLNSPMDAEGCKVTVKDPQTPVDVMVKRTGASTYAFAVGMRNAPAEATFALSRAARGTVEVLGEDRKIPIRQGQFTDTFTPYAVHLYRWPAKG